MSVTVRVKVSQLRLGTHRGLSIHQLFASLTLRDPRFLSGAMTTLEEKTVVNGLKTKPDSSTSGECSAGSFLCWHFLNTLSK